MKLYSNHREMDNGDIERRNSFTAPPAAPPEEIDLGQEWAAKELVVPGAQDCRHSHNRIDILQT